MGAMKRLHTARTLGTTAEPPPNKPLVTFRPWTLPRRAREGKPRTARGIIRPAPVEPAPSPGPRFLETTPGPDREPATTQRTMFD